MLDLDTIFRLSSYTGKAQRYFKSGFKTLIKVITVLVILFTIWIIGAIYWDDIELQYYKIIWGPELIFDKLSPEMTRSDVIFIMGEPSTRVVDPPAYNLDNPRGYIWDDPETFVVFENDKVSWIDISKPFSNPPPFNTVEELKTILGEEDILSISKDYLTRSYTYLESGITFVFRVNDLSSAVMVGDVKWGVGYDDQVPFGEVDISEYVVNGKVICPSENCPWDDEGNLKPEYEGKSYRDFL
ncbi:MAG: hypothetical protein OXU27_04440 [Candidatus Poribacteria bacterium]|nr:hypothetical protein [Candidatus Poribacteria bacterium]